MRSAALRALSLILAGSIAFGPACAGRLRRTLKPPEEAQALDHRSPYLKVHARDGGLYVLSEWRVDEAERLVSGRGEQLAPNREVLSTGSFTIPLNEVALFETNVVHNSPAVTGLAVITGISLAVTAACLANPKACFGSCPTFYVTDGRGPVLQAEGFSSSIAPSLEARDLDALYRAHPVGRDVVVTMKNEALETHVVREVRLLVARRPPHGRVFATPEGKFWEASDLREPLECLADEGDCRAKVRAFDGDERSSLTDGEDLARRETIELRLPIAPGPRGLVIASRQSLVSTYLFYQSLAFLGDSAGESLAALERGDPAVRRGYEGLRNAVGGIEVEAEEGSGGWRPVGEVREMGPLATDVVVLPLPPETTGRVRLRMARGHWRLDYLASARLDARTEALPLDPVSVRGGPNGRPTSWPDRPLATLPGDVYTFAYRLPGQAPDYELFLESRGYYLEWMRDEWRADADLRRAARLFLDPQQALRDLAPEFKKQEAQMESLFWRSRYAQP